MKTRSDRPIIYSAPMVRALLAGRKTMTRRLITSPLRKAQPGDRLWVRESWREDSPDDPQGALYMADGHAGLPPGFKWKPSIHMPRWASRLTLVVTAVKVELLQDISADDAVAEGLWYCEEGGAAGFWFADPSMEGPFGEGSVECFEHLWEHLHGADSWAANPEVVAISFRVERANVDQMQEAA